ncbi:sugar transferase [Suipraeoptans intestinalis]|uniref:sugar transferase n=1 Tax=Suipraeoptans intestinalis TaxID=2606628 RepID=UPI0023F12F7D|nr:sugar transferase [Suipraeoptans intestinalis]MDD7770613.1 sugar transferase [Suipraeoptans intestinalis]MDY3121176.1 sugar transferase [Suipraeoptans intestinalis]
MYSKARSGWMKHIDFIMLDQICLGLSFAVAFFLHGRDWSRTVGKQAYWKMFLVLLLLQVFVTVFFETFRNVLKRGYYEELKATFKNTALIFLMLSAYLLLAGIGDEYCKMIWILTGGIYLALTYGVRSLWKRRLFHKKKKQIGKHSLLILTTRELADTVIQRIRENNYGRFRIRGIILTDDGKKEEQIQGIPVVAEMGTVLEYIRTEWVDEIFLHLAGRQEAYQDLIAQCVKMGVTVHCNHPEMEENDFLGKRLVERMNSYTVLTYSANVITSRQAAVKRAIDILGGTVGCLITLGLLLVIGPIIYIQSPGPVFFSQERVGKNGRRFKIYKFRSMYLDAEGRKKELLKKNRNKEGLMFKVEDDPRIIGNYKGPGRGIGSFIRKTSLDEFPQFWNVLKGEMSLVGTRPPLVEEWERYSKHHRARMATIPGMTGLWQVNGRSEVTDFEKVVKWDVEYIENWSMELDFRLILQTVGVMISGKGSM